jgi:hypothetical protein
MKNVKMLGSGCKRCVVAAGMEQTEADRLGIRVSIEKITDYAAVASLASSRRRE